MEGSVGPRGHCPGPNPKKHRPGLRFRGLPKWIFLQTFFIVAFISASVWAVVFGSAENEHEGVDDEENDDDLPDVKSQECGRQL